MTIPRLETATLDNGLKVAVAPSNSPGVAVNLWYQVGSIDETTHRCGFAHLFEHLMFQGSTNVASGEHMALLEAVGASVNATTSSERTNYFETVPRSALELALWLEADRLAALDLSEANFLAQREVVKEEKRQRYDNQPYGDLLQLLIEQHFPKDHPYGHTTIGSMPDLDAATLADVEEFFHAWYRPRNASLVLAGAVSVDDGFRLAEQYLGAIPGGPPRPPRTLVDRQTQPPSSIEVIRPVPYSLAYLSWQTSPATAEDQSALDLALTILASGHTARLHRALVQRDRLAQEVHAMTLPHQYAPSLAVIMARPTEKTLTATTTTALRDEVARFAAEGPTEPEFERALAQAERDWLWQLATVEERADLLNEAWHLWGDPRALYDEIAKLRMLTPEDLRKATARWLMPETAYELRYQKGMQ